VINDQFFKWHVVRYWTLPCYERGRLVPVGQYGGMFGNGDIYWFFKTGDKLMDKARVRKLVDRLEKAIPGRYIGQKEEFRDICSMLKREINKPIFRFWRRTP